jgi:hypothetical protein
MSIDGTTSVFDLIQQMQPSDDLQNLWMMFNHIKHVQGWTTMAYHIYGPFYCKDMAISVCDMQSKDTKVQCILWKKLNTFVERKGLGMIAFKGSMENNAQAN